MAEPNYAFVKNNNVLVRVLVNVFIETIFRYRCIQNGSESPNDGASRRYLKLPLNRLK